MKDAVSFRRVAVGAMLALGTVGLMSGCATKGYVRSRVDDSSKQLSARMDKDEEGINVNIKANSSQIEELNGVTRDHSQKISTLEGSLEQTDSKAQQALTVGEGAQNTATKAVGQISELDSKFQNRNHYIVLKEEQVRFKFNSAKLEDSFKKVLDDVAQQLKDNPDAILVMEGHTDSTGPADYNIQVGERRVEAVKRYLVVDQEVPINRISAMSFGVAKPISRQQGKEARAQNRAVVVRVMGPQLSPKEGIVSQSR
jgi:outer membrane protein OmpA-like peptidoglycan-associated protein